MGSIGDCYDNGQMESFWAPMQVELLNRKRWNTRLELANAIFEYLEILHNRQRRHSSLGMLSPPSTSSVTPTTQPETKRADRAKPRA
jgi:putative transposase